MQAKVMGMRVEKLSQKEMNSFIAKFDYQKAASECDQIEEEVMKWGIKEVFRKSS